MNGNYTLTGGAKIGNARASYPFAKLYVDKNVLKINASIIGNLVFQPKDIISIKPQSGLIFNGIQISHRVGKYDLEVIFWVRNNPMDVIREIERTGFLENTISDTMEDNPAVVKIQQQGGLPIKKSVGIFYIVAWNVLAALDIIPNYLNPNSARIFGLGFNLAFALLFGSCIAVITSSKFRKLVLKEGRDFNDIGRFAYFLAIISGIFLVSTTLANLALWRQVFS